MRVCVCAKSVMCRVGIAACLVILAARPALAQAQGPQTAPPQTAPPPAPPPQAVPVDNGGIGEKYHIEFSYTWWQPGLGGNVTSDRLGLIGSRVDLTSDLALESSQFSDLRFVLRPAKKHRIRVQYTPIKFSGAGTLSRDITFGGQVFPVSLPVESQLTWTVLRVGYEWDFFYRPRGFVGVIVEGGLTQLTASIDSFIGGASAEGSSPLVAFGMAGRFYPIRHLAINLEGTGLQLTDVKADNLLKTLALDFSATYNFTRYVGVSGGWRRTDTALKINGDSGELDFKGFWIGGVVRY